jgi:hypothetical protein
MRSYSLCRAEEMFEIVLDYPDSAPTLLEVTSNCIPSAALKSSVFLSRTKVNLNFTIISLKVKEASVRSSTQALIGKAFRAHIVKRLLHPGASTSQVICRSVISTVF